MLARDDKICVMRGSLRLLPEAPLKDNLKAAKRKRLEAYISVRQGAAGKVNEEIALLENRIYFGISIS
jgi:hypothetical protein